MDSSPATLSNYEVTLVNGTLTVTKAPLTIKADNQTMTYGGTLPALTATYTGLVNGDTAASLTTPVSLATTAATSPAGAYDITASGATSPNYTISFVSGTLTIAKAALTISANPASKIYGEPNPAFSVSYAGFVNGDDASTLGGTLTFSTSADATSPVGSYEVTPSGLTSGNYTISFVKGTLTVSAKALTITANSTSKTYGQTVTFTGAEFSTAGLVNGDTVASVSLVSAGAAATASVAGSPYTITPSAAVGMGLSNYTISYSTGTLTVNTAVVTVTPANASRVYGGANPTFSGTVVGLENSDNITASYSTTATAASTVGSYAITATLADPDGKLGNYTVTLNTGTLTITKATLTVTADNQSKVYGQTNPTLTATITGFVNSDTASVVSGSAAFTTVATAISPVQAGGYPIEVTQGTLAAANYDLAASTYIDGTLTITPKTATVAADAKGKTYGEANPALTATVGGTIPGDTLDYSLATTATAGSGVGNYPIAVTPGTNPNYSVTATDGTLAVSARAVTITADAKTKTYGGTDPALTYAITSGTLASGDTFSGGLTRAAGENVGAYAIGQGGVALSANYTLTFVGATLTIGTKAAAVSAVANGKTYGAPDPALGTTDSGFLAADLGAGKITFSASRATGETVAGGPYTITPAASDNGTGLLGNYAITYNTAAFAIGKADATIDVSSYTGVYDGNAHGATGTAKGVTGESLSGLDLGASFTAVPGGTTTWTYTDATGNYNNATGTAAIVIGTATSTTAVTCTAGPFTYTGAAIAPCTATATGAGISTPVTLTVTYTANVTVGTATASATYAGDANHEGSTDTKTFAIGKASTTTVPTRVSGNEGANVVLKATVTANTPSTATVNQGTHHLHGQARLDHGLEQQCASGHQRPGQHHLRHRCKRLGQLHRCGGIQRRQQLQWQ